MGAAVVRRIQEKNVARVYRVAILLEHGLHAVTHGAEKILHDRGVLCIPDFIANAGGVICAAMEYHGSSQSAAMQAIEEKLRRNTEMVLETSRKKNILPRQASMELAMERIQKAMSFRRHSLFSTANGWI